jgi:steroid 5-alpha reductase family enzyme
MDTLTQIYLPNLAAALALMFIAWTISLPKKDVSIIDIFWGLGFVLIAWLTFLRADGYTGRKILITLLATLWGIRLAAYIFLRGRGKGEDPRYTAMRAKHGERFRLVSLYKIFALQAFLCWSISLVVQVGQVSSLPARLTWLDALGTLIWVTGFFFESVGDWQLARFKADPANKGKVMDRGLWAFSRHPNYFGESLMWWGIYGIALSTPGSAWAVISPAIITFLLLKVSGVTLLEKTIVETRPQYRDYIQRTSAFIPWFPEKKG